MTIQEDLQERSKNAIIAQINEQVYDEAAKGKSYFFHYIPNFHLRDNVLKELIDTLEGSGLRISQSPNPENVNEKDSSGILIEWWY